MAHKLFAVALVSAAALAAPGYAFAGDQASSGDWKPPQVVGQPGYKEEVAKPREAAAPRAIGQDPYAARNPNMSSENRYGRIEWSSRRAAAPNEIASIIWPRRLNL